MDDKNVKAILIARGGYGTMRIIDEINFNALRENPKWLIGYSDVTVLHSALHLQNIASLHATMPINFEKNEEATNTLFNIIEGKKINYQYNYQASLNKSLYKIGQAKEAAIFIIENLNEGDYFNIISFNFRVLAN